jgi:hypothetical protein
MKFRNPSAVGSRTEKASASVVSWVASVRPGRKGTVTVTPARLAASSTAAQPARTTVSANEMRLPPPAEALKSLWIFSRAGMVSARASGSLTAHSFCGARRTRPPLAPPRLSVPRKDPAAANAAATRREIGRPLARISFLSDAMSVSSTSA